MQSYLQYRKFGKAVEEEHARHTCRASATRNANNEGCESQIRSPSELLSSSTPESEETEPKEEVEEAELIDLEKAETQRDDHSIDRPSCLPLGVCVMTRDEARSVRDMGHLPEDGQRSEANEIAQTYSCAESPGTLSAITTRSRTAGGLALGTAMTGVDVRDRTTREGEKGELVFVVDFQGPDDPSNPHNWGYGIRIFCTLSIASIGFVVGFASAIDSSAISYASKEFGVSEVTESLATGLYLIGFGVGALFAGPFSETLGRNPVYIATIGLYMVFVMASALAPNIGAQLVFRFLAGFFGSTPLVCAGGSISDIWNPTERVLTFPIFANAAFSGPILGPVVGGYIVSSKILGNWRWVDWVTLIISAVVLSLVVLFQPETYAATLHRWRASHLRRVTGDPRFRAQSEIRSQTFMQRLGTALYRPFLLTAREPVVILVALYLTVIYIILFTFLDGYTYIFADIHGTSEGVTGLCFVGILIGLFCATALVPLIYSWAKRDLKKIQEQGGTRLPPEERLWFMMLGGAVSIPFSLFWMGWTSYSSISIWSSLAASVFFGYGVLTVFISCYQYIIDSYETYSASALVSITLIRYVAAGGMTVVGIPFYENMGVQYTLTILACISCLLVPLPYVFYKYGKWIRSKSKYGTKFDV